MSKGKESVGSEETARRKLTTSSPFLGVLCPLCVGRVQNTYPNDFTSGRAVWAERGALENRCVEANCGGSCGEEKKKVGANCTSLSYSIPPFPKVLATFSFEWKRKNRTMKKVRSHYARVQRFGCPEGKLTMTGLTWQVLVSISITHLLFLIFCLFLPIVFWHGLNKKVKRTLISLVNRDELLEI